MHLNDIPEGPSPHRMTGHARLSRDAWETIKERYLAGEGAAFLAELFGVSLSAVRARARADGWRRTDGPDPDIAAPPTTAELARDGRPNFNAMADTAMRRAARAVTDGHLAEAQGWTRVGRSLAAAARRERPRDGD